MQTCTKISFIKSCCFYEALNKTHQFPTQRVSHVLSHNSAQNHTRFHTSCRCCVHRRCIHRRERENAQRFGALSQDLFNWNDFAKFSCLCLKWEKYPVGNKTLKFYHYWRIYMLWILNSGFSTCCSCSEAIQIFFFVPHGHQKALASSSLASSAASCAHRDSVLQEEFSEVCSQLLCLLLLSPGRSPMACLSLSPQRCMDAGCQP